MNKEVEKIFSRVILSERTIRIKLLGDSITHGVGGTGFEQNGEPIVADWCRNPMGHCWANQFKKYMESQFNCIVINNACTGTRTSFVLEHFDKLVEEEDDIILCAIGTNNRQQRFNDTPPIHTRHEHMELFYKDIIALYEKMKNTGKDFIFIANIPASVENERDGQDFYRLFHMNDVQDIYVKASAIYDFPLIRLYTLFLEYCEQRNISVDSLLKDGLHPNDMGHDVIFNLLLNEIGIAKRISS